MKAVVFEGEGRMRVADESKPEAMGSKDAVLRVTTPAIRGSDPYVRGAHGAARGADGGPRDHGYHRAPAMRSRAYSPARS